ncbi:ABC transporter substrate-binding protein [Bradyrhizobium sp. CNPSo 4010]|uniref:ABC transporter substrate-binding protein n=1 Tax=Bradyrhizobium agreste TaxID=2751811 RepID=A0ABS0PZ57_9BRAD|nr:ABC transporter substrate-binding protein [Bradyrhizobium agreste]MBH5402124.1 ABC transporter substrate-binding protein [Bradyrhizobium agreste]
MRRREFIGALASTLAARPLTAQAQRTRSVWRLGHLTVDPRELAPFLQGLHDLGYAEGQNIIIETRSAGDKSDRLGDLAAELVQLNVDVIYADGSQATRAALSKTTTIPIVMISSNPVGLGFVRSLAKPGGNVTGLSLLGPEVSGKRLGMLKQMIPGISRVAVLWNPDDPGALFSLRDTQAAAAELSLNLQILQARNVSAIEDALEAAANEKAEAVVILPAPIFAGITGQIAGLAIQKRLPTLYFFKGPVKAGLLMSYGADIPATARRAAYFVDRILKGASPADLPVEQPTKFELAINLRTAKALDLTIPPTLLAAADDLIE